MAIEMKIEKITPERAAHYLKRNVDNYRKISKAKVALYAEEMKAGKWQLNGEGIMFDQTGKLKNGQHRLAAVMMAGVPVEMAVITGVADDVMIYDNGFNRTTMQMAQAMGYGDVTQTEAAVATWIVGGFNNRVPKGKVLEWLNGNHSEVNRAFRITGAQNSRNLSRRVGCVMATWLMLQTESMKSYELEVFWKIFNSGNTVGTDGYEPSSALVARRMFAERYKSAPTDKRSLTEQVEILLRAMQDFRKGTPRQMNYQVKEPMICTGIMEKALKKAGVEGK